LRYTVNQLHLFALVTNYLTLNFKSWPS